MYEYVSKDTSSTIRPGIRRRRTGTSQTSLSRVPQNRQAGCNPTQGDPVLPARMVPPKVNCFSMLLSYWGALQTVPLSYRRQIQVNEWTIMDQIQRKPVIL